MQLKDKVILVTGASSGIGRAVALALGRTHNSIVITARRRELLSATAEEIQKNGSEAVAIPGDAVDEAQAAAAVQETVKRFGRIDLALLNIGRGPGLDIANCTPEQVKENMRQNYDSMINYFCPVVQQMKSQPGGGVIAHTNSLAGFLGLPGEGQYSAAKAACRIFLDTARIELKRYNIRVVTVCPGFVITERNKHPDLPKSLPISMERAAQYILKALEREERECLFPPSLKVAVTIGRSLPRPLQDSILAKFMHT